jgi:hypothetical protein
MRQLDFYEFTGVIAPGTAIVRAWDNRSVLISAGQSMEASAESGSPVRG